MFTVPGHGFVETSVAWMDSEIYRALCRVAVPQRRQVNGHFTRNFTEGNITVVVILSKNHSLIEHFPDTIVAISYDE